MSVEGERVSSEHNRFCIYTLSFQFVLPIIETKQLLVKFWYDTELTKYYYNVQYTVRITLSG